MKNQLCLHDLYELTLPVKLTAYTKFNRFYKEIEVLYVGNHSLFIRDLEDGLEDTIPLTDIEYYRLNKEFV